MTQKMRVVEIRSPGGPDALTTAMRPVPIPGYGQVAIRLAYAGVNRPDALQRAGVYDPPPGASDLPGLEGAGEIVALGAGVTQWQVGDRVCALLPGGGYAEYVTTLASHCLPIPKRLGMRRAACLPETFFTVWTNVFMRGRLRAGERFLVHGGSSGIGTAAIQLASAFGAAVFATAGSDAKCRACLELGAVRAINYREEDFVRTLLDHGGADVILDMVGGDYIRRNIRTLADDGRLVQIAFLEGADVKLNFAQMMVRRLTITGSTLRPQSDLAKARIAESLRERVWPLIETGGSLLLSIVSLSWRTLRWRMNGWKVPDISVRSCSGCVRLMTGEGNLNARSPAVVQRQWRRFRRVRDGLAAVSSLLGTFRGIRLADPS